MKKAILYLMIGTVILIAGNASRPYSAFGGEDLAYIALAVAAVRELIISGKENKKYGTRTKRRGHENSKRKGIA